MGLFKDLRNLQKQVKDLTPPEYRGVEGGFKALKDGVAQASDVIGDMQQGAAQRQHLLANGRAGTATIGAIRQTGVWVNENPQVELDLDVTVEGLPTYSTTHRQVIQQVAIPQYQPGATVAVRVDPDNPTTLLVE